VGFYTETLQKNVGIHQKSTPALLDGRPLKSQKSTTRDQHVRRFFAVCRFMPENPQLVWIFRKDYNLGIIQNNPTVLYPIENQLVTDGLFFGLFFESFQK